MEKANEIHECGNLPKQGIQIVRESDNIINGPEKIWILNIFREASEQDIEENHYLECVGDLIWCTSVEITHCPYCGRNLYESKKTMEVVKFTHLDLSSWKSKRM